MNSSASKGIDSKLSDFNEREDYFIAGPRSRTSELITALHIFWECIRGFRTLHFVGPCVTIFGSARTPENSPYYKLARETAAEIAKLGLTVMTGGGPGIMEAANRGAKDVNGHSIGCNIRLPKEQKPNPYLDTMIDFRYFFVRKLMLIKYSYAFVVLPGGFGTLDEIFETATLIQTGKISDFPIIVMGDEYWRPMYDFVEDSLLGRGMVDREDVDRVILSDSPIEVASCIADCMQRKLGPQWRSRCRLR